jgi:hypothetical protein
LIVDVVFVVVAVLRVDDMFLEKEPFVVLVVWLVVVVETNVVFEVLVVLVDVSDTVFVDVTVVFVEVDDVTERVVLDVFEVLDVVVELVVEDVTDVVLVVEVLVVVVVVATVDDVVEVVVLLPSELTASTGLLTSTSQYPNVQVDTPAKYSPAFQEIVNDAEE